MPRRENPSTRNAAACTADPREEIMAALNEFDIMRYGFGPARGPQSDLSSSTPGPPSL